MLARNTHIFHIKEDEMDRALWNVWGRKEMHRGVCWGNMKERDCLKDAGVDGRIILRCITEPIWFRVGTSDELLQTQ